MPVVKRLLRIYGSIKDSSKGFFVKPRVWIVIILIELCIRVLQNYLMRQSFNEKALGYNKAFDWEKIAGELMNVLECENNGAKML